MSANEAKPTDAGSDPASILKDLSLSSKSGPTTSSTSSAPAISSPTALVTDSNAPVASSSTDSEPATTEASISPSEATTKPKKQAIVVYEGDERWQPPRQAKFANPGSEPNADGEEQEEEEEGSDSGDEEDDAEDDEEDDEEGDEAASGDLLAGYPDDAEDIQLLHSKIASLPLLRLPRFAKTLHTLCLRQNAISSLPASEFGPLTELEELDVYDNAIKDEGVGKGSGVVGLAKLRILDLSFNLLRAVPPILDTLPSLHTVYFVQNKITKIDGLDSPSIGASLTSLELGGNRIRMIEGLGALVNLEELWLGKNKITKLENLSSLTKLRILSIQSNRIVKIENLDALENLEELYLSHNGVEKLEGLEKNVKLTTLDVGNNRVPEVENLSHLKALTELWLNDNQIPTLHALSPELGHIAALETIYLEGNPCQRDDQSGYRRKVQLALPQVQQVDATCVSVPVISIYSLLWGAIPLFSCLGDGLVPSGCKSCASAELDLIGLRF